MPVATGPGSVDRTSSYSLNELLALAHYVGFKGQSQANVAAIALAESGGNPNASHVNTDGSIDRGLYQINNRFHPDVSDSCAYDPVCSTRAVMAMTGGGKTFSPDPWNPSVDHWTSQLPKVEAAQKAGGWKQFQSQFASDQVAATPPSQGSSSSSGGGNLLFQCSSSGGGGFLAQAESVATLGHAGGSVEQGLVGGVGCYLESAMLFTLYAVGGLLLVGAGLLLVARKNPAKLGAKAVMAAAVPETAAVPKPPSPSLQLQQQREARISARQAQGDPLAASRARAEASKVRAQAAAIREQTAGQKARRKYGAAAGLTPETKSILGVDVPTFDIPGFSASQMGG